MKTAASGSTIGVAQAKNAAAIRDGPQAVRSMKLSLGSHRPSERICSGN
jgi:hypothetical protein